MSKVLRTIAILAAIAVAVVSAQFWVPIVVYGILYLETQALGGRCGGSPIILRLQGNGECRRSDESPVTRENANIPIGDPSECPLIYAVDFNNAVIFKELVSKGAKPNLCKGFPDEFFERMTNCRNDPAQAAQIFAELERLGVRATNSNRLLISQAKAKCVPGIELAVSQGADVNAEGLGGYLALHYTTQFADVESIVATAALVRLGADPMRRTAQNDAPYVQARERLHNVGNWARLESALAGSVSK